MSWLPDIHFEISERKVLLRIMDIVFIFSFLIIISEWYNVNYFIIDNEHYIWVIVLVVYYSLFATIFEMYDLKKASSFQSTLKNATLAVSSTTLFYILTPFLTPVLPDNRLQILSFYLAILGGVIIWRYAYFSFITSPRFFKKVLVVGDSFDINRIVTNLHQADPNYKVVGFSNTDSENTIAADPSLKNVSIDKLPQFIKKEGISEIVVASSYAEGVSISLYNQLIKLLENGFSIREYTQVYEEITQRVPIEYVEKDFYKFFPFNRSNRNRFYLFFNRVFDVLFALFCLTFTLAILPFIILGNALGNKGSLFYLQERIGQNGKPFKIVKFRTMQPDPYKEEKQYSDRAERKITWFGNVLRRTRFDELPQCFNILKGDMSLIGPRPERPLIAKELAGIVPFYETRHVVKPGLTGWAQVMMSRYGTSYDDALVKLQYDLYYIKKRTLFLDIDILIKTISTIIYFRGQ
ncbi:exopolysaccharide biosynthesis polyprenyl glycosylphosphotransferase [Leeuwenhoekiella sp. A16]|uniref:exopolysaccharide biosynthesis polyprenyl glycosylphosphotransferase n=1 Tax=Leeuwenhoekiella sp. A16 TaxID=3141462 RepID=UPI003A7FA251